MILYKKGIVRNAKNSNISSVQARRIRAALTVIQNTPVDKLTKLDKIKKIRVANRDDIYVYRVDLRNRIILSIDPKQGKAIIQNIVDSEKLRG